MGVAFSVMESSGILLTIAICFEVLFLDFTFSVTFANNGMKRSSIIILIFAMSSLLLIGGTLGYWILGMLEPTWQVAVMAFGCVALLYLVTEELLVEAHKTTETTMGPLLLFLGFGAMLVASMIL